MKIKLPSDVSPLFATLQSRLGTVSRVGYACGTSAAVAGDVFAVKHDLGVIPEALDGNPVEQAKIWWTEGDRKLWSATSVRLRCSVAGIKVFVRVETRQ